MAGFTFVGREAELVAFQQFLDRPRGELLLVAGPEGSGKSHLLRQFRHEAEQAGRHVVQHLYLDALLDADLRQYAILSALAAACGAGAPGQAGEPAPVRLVPNPRELFGYLLGEDRRPVSAKLAGLLAVASATLEADSRLVLLLDMGRAEGRDAFPAAYFARRLPEKVKIVLATNLAPDELDGLESVTALPPLPPFNEAEVRRIVEFHHPRGSAFEPLVKPILAKFQGNPLLTDLAAKLVAGGWHAVPADLPATASGLCQLLLGTLGHDERRLAECLARLPSGADAAALRALLDVPDAEAHRILFLDGARNIVLTRRTARGSEARIFHECFADIFLEGQEAEVAALHKRAAAHFLSVLASNPHDVEALSAHSYHIRLAGDRTQFMQDFPRTLRPKNGLRLLHLLASEYRLLLLWSRGGEAPLNRPVCMANLARICQELGDHAEALRHHRDALEVYQRQNDRSGTAAQLAAIASVLCDLGHHDEAAKSLGQAISLDEAAGNRAALAADWAGFGVLQERAGSLQEALRAHERALELYRSLKNEPDAASEVAHLAAIHHRLGRTREAIALYQEAWRLNNRLSATRAEVECLRQLGVLFKKSGDMEKAVNCLQQAVGLDHSLGDRHAEAEHLRALAALHLELQEPAEAASRLEEAVGIASSYGDPAGEATGLLDLARAHRAAGRPAEARVALERAAAAAARLSDAALAEQARAALAEFDAAQPQQQPVPAELPEPVPAADAEPMGDVTLEEPEALAGGDAAPASQGAGEAAELRTELEAARSRIRELEAELGKVKKIASALRDILGKGTQG